MIQSEAVKILQHLINGIDPHTGEEIPMNNPIRHLKTVRALGIALKALQGLDVTELVRAEIPENSANSTAIEVDRQKREPNANAGQPWMRDEEEELARQYDGGMSITEIAVLHKRSRGAIRSRLLRLGRLAPLN